ncbi:TPA: DUF3696 domain-containing protein [Vibrio parahaemolyticus]|nr:DUF3696 domain-containing protein [Vibrio parahaemolyticus]EGR1726876.1 DUF3696 domain-containing protein [Vibrio parahaemolyticus]
MLKKIKIENIRSIEHMEYDFKNLNLLSGLNSSGKSTLISIVNLLKQMDIKSIKLNGDFCKFVSVGSCLYYWRDSEDKGSVFYEMKSGKSGEIEFLSSDADRDTIDNKVYDLIEDINIRYLSSDRMSPEWTYPINSDCLTSRELGAKGELSPYFISQLGQCSEISIPELAFRSYDCKEEEVSLNLKVNVEKWLGVICPGVQFNSSADSNINASKLLFGFSDVTMFSPHSVGFGLSHTLPVILMVLTAEKGDILLIENPELNLHPEGQMAIGRLLSLAANNDVQVIVETHSDHIINAARLAIKNGEISSESVNLTHFYQDSEGSGFSYKVFTSKKTVEILENGKVCNAPKGFFDTWENSLMELL